jgi:hypothetical protein
MFCWPMEHRIDVRTTTLDTYYKLSTNLRQYFVVFINGLNALCSEYEGRGQKFRPFSGRSL